jgi:hypothetical protein
VDGHHQGRLVGRPEPGIAGPDDGELGEVVGVGLDPLGQDLQPELAPRLDARDRGFLRVPPLRDHPRGSGCVVDGMHLDPQRGQELLALCERLPVGIDASDALEASAPHGEQGVIDSHDGLPEHLDQGAVQQQLVGLVHGAGL